MAMTGFHLQRGNMLEQALWGRCLVERAAAFSVYNRGSRIRKMIHALKYEGRTDIGRCLGELYGSALAESSFMEGIDMIIPVPLHRSRLRSRGYNQSEYIATGLSAATGVPARKDLLLRISQSGSQTKHGRYGRWENVQGLFRSVKPHETEGRHLLLVDDVITTGSTVEACVNALHEAADVKVSVVALAVAQKLTL
jgi:ComF family protein